MLSIPPDKMKVRLDDESPGATLLAAQTESEHRVELLQIELLPTRLRLVNQIPDLMTMVHLVARVGGKAVDLLPGQLSELQKGRVNDMIPLLRRPFTHFAPRPSIQTISLGDAPGHSRIKPASILDGSGRLLSLRGSTRQMWSEPWSMAEGFSIDVSRLRRNIDFGEERRLTGLEFFLRERFA